MLPALTALLPAVGNVLEKIIPDPQAAAKAKLELMRLYQEGNLAELEAASSAITAEAKSEHWITANWRPVTMLTFVALVVAHWLGFTPENLPHEQVMQLLEIVKIGLGGYVIGRSAEKGIKAWKNGK